MDFPNVNSVIIHVSIALVMDKTTVMTVLMVIFTLVLYVKNVINKTHIVKPVQKRIIYAHHAKKTIY